MFKLDYSKASLMQISNDAYHYLRFEEDPIDEDNLDEAYEILAMFPNGFIISDNINIIKGTDLIECEIVPYIQDEWKYGMYIDLFNGWQIQISLLLNGNAEIRYYNPSKEPSQIEICKVLYNCDGKPYIWTAQGSMYSLWKANLIKSL